MLNAINVARPDMPTMTAVVGQMLKHRSRKALPAVRYSEVMCKAGKLDSHCQAPPRAMAVPSSGFIS